MNNSIIEYESKFQIIEYLFKLSINNKMLTIIYHKVLGCYLF